MTTPSPSNEFAPLTDIPDEPAVLIEDTPGRLRRDIASGQSVDTAGLIRFVVGPDGALVPDLTQKLPGRGLWIASERAALETALKKNIFSRAAKRQVKAGPDLLPMVHDLLRRRCLDLLGLARREGGIVNGFEKVLSTVKAGGVGWLVEASDGAEDGRKRILSAAKAQNRVPNLCGTFSNAELSLALGTENAIHVALLSGRRVQRWSLEMKRLSGFEPLVPEAWRPPGT